MQAIITRRGQITLPKALRDRLHLSPGDRVEFVLDDNNVIRLIPRTTSISQLKGMLPKPERPISIKEMAEAITGGGDAIDP